MSNIDHSTNVTLLLQEELNLVRRQVQSLKSDIDNSWVLINAFLIFFMSAGFSLLEAGSVRLKNISNIMLKNLLTTGMSTIGWFMVGYGLGFGKGNVIFGTDSFFLFDNSDGSYYSMFVFQTFFLVCACTIVSGSIAERANISAYLCFCWIQSVIIYPIVVHAFWSQDGWLSPSNSSHPVTRFGCLDFAGGSVIHLSGGLCGLAGTIMLGPRIGRFGKNGKAVKIHGHSKTLVLLGGFILWFGWYGFNAGSTLQVSNRKSEISALAATNTTIAAAAAVITTVFTNCIRTGRYELTEALNGLLAGCVCITPCCGYVLPWASLIIGASASIVYSWSSSLLECLKIDDPLNAVPVHGFCGAFGTICVGLFADRGKLIKLYELSEDEPIPYGLFVGGGWEQIGMQFLGVTFVTIFTLVSAFITFFIIDRLVGLRVKKEVEIRGLDLYTGMGLDIYQHYPSPSAGGGMGEGLLNRYGLPHGTKLLPSRRNIRGNQSAHSSKSGSSSVVNRSRRSDTHDSSCSGTHTAGRETLVISERGDGLHSSGLHSSGEEPRSYPSTQDLNTSSSNLEKQETQGFSLLSMLNQELVETNQENPPAPVNHEEVELEEMPPDFQLNSTENSDDVRIDVSRIFDND